MGEGKGLRLYVLIGAFMIGLFVGATAIFGDGLGSFEGGLVEEDPNCVLATDDDFFGTGNGDFNYKGSSDCVKIPHVIKGEDVTSYKFMFNGTSVSKVVSDNPNVTDMSNMFGSSQATELDVSSIDTSNVTDMSWMFADSQATELDLSSFDTSNVTDMHIMFTDSQATEIKGLENFDTSNVTDMNMMFFSSEATELDLSSFNTSNVTDMTQMFYNSQAKTVYARTQADADKYNASLNKPIGLQVIVKQ